MRAKKLSLTVKEREQFARLFKLAKSLENLQAWEWMALSDCFGVQPAGYLEPYFVIFGGEPGKMHFVRMLAGMGALIDLLQGMKNPDSMHLAGLLNLPMLELMFLDKEQLFDHELNLLKALKMPIKKGANNMVFRKVIPGHFPAAIALADGAGLEKFLYQACGMAMRVEADGMMLKESFPEELLIRRENSAGEWHDEWIELAPLHRVVREVPFDSEKLKALSNRELLPLVVQVELVMLPYISKADPNGELIKYALWIVDAESGELLADFPFNARRGVEYMWQEIPPKLVDFFEALGGFPQRVEVREGRMANLLRPLCEWLPFKMVHFEKLDKIDRVMEGVFEEL